MAAAVLRHRITLSLMLFLSFIAFASYHKVSRSGCANHAWVMFWTNQEFCIVIGILLTLFAYPTLPSFFD